MESYYCLPFSSCHYSINYILTHFITLKKILQRAKTPSSRSTNNSYWYLHVMGEDFPPEIAAVWVVVLGSTLLTPQRSTQRCLKLLHFSLALCRVSKFSYESDTEWSDCTKFFVFPLCPGTHQHWLWGCSFKKPWASVCIPQCQPQVAAAQHGGIT